MTWVKSSAVAWLVVALVPAACVGRVAPEVPASAPSVDVAQLWEDPADIASRDLFYGPGEAALAPAPGSTFAFVKTDSGGYSPGYDVRGADGTEWSVKLGNEAQTEVAVSRILWAIGYHQVPTYYVTSWTMTGGPEGAPGPARFRPDVPKRKAVGEWSWYENDFLQTQPFKGLVVINVLQSLVRKSNIVAQLEVRVGEWGGGWLILTCSSPPSQGLPPKRQPGGAGWRVRLGAALQDARLF